MFPYESDLARIDLIAEKIAIVEISEGQDVCLNKIQQLQEQLESYIKGDYGIIVHRKNSYSFDPIAVYKALDQLPRLKGIAIVNNKLEPLPAGSEKRFFHGALEYFDSVQNAFNWISQTLSTKNIEFGISGADIKAD